MSLDVVYIVQQLGIESQKFNVWKETVLLKQEDQEASQNLDDGHHDAE